MSFSIRSWHWMIRVCSPLAHSNGSVCPLYVSRDRNRCRFRRTARPDRGRRGDCCRCSRHCRRQNYNLDCPLAPPILPAHTHTVLAHHVLANRFQDNVPSQYTSRLKRHRVAQLAHADDRTACRRRTGPAWKYPLAASCRFDWTHTAPRASLAARLRCSALPHRVCHAPGINAARRSKWIFLAVRMRAADWLMRSRISLADSAARIRLW